jgi:hypothetical protein
VGGVAAIMRTIYLSKLEVIFCAFLAENIFVNALILFIRVSKMLDAPRRNVSVASTHLTKVDHIVALSPEGKKLIKPYMQFRKILL